MDITLLNYTNQKLDKLLSEINDSNLTQETKWDLQDLINTAKEQIQQCRDIGWLPNIDS